MGVHLIQAVSQWAGAAALVAWVGCIVAGVLSVQMSASYMLPGDKAYDLARTMAVMGGTCILVAGVTSTLYYWLVGVASARSALLIEGGLLATALVFAGVIGLMRDRRRLGASR